MFNLIMLDIIMVFRKPFTGQVSIEYLFYTISQHLREKRIRITNIQMPRHSKGLWNRILNVVSMVRYKNRIVHITGDVHYALLGALFCKRVLTIHDFNFMLHKNFVARSIYWLFWIYLPVKFAHRVTVISQSTKAELQRYVQVAEEKVVVIGDFIDDIYKPVPKKFNDACPRILQVGTTFNKNIPRLLEALSSIACTLVIIGRIDDATKNLLVNYSINFENKYGIPLAELYDEYCKADLLCYASTSEGFGMPILEAQACGTPVVTSNCSSMPEVAGLGAVLVNPFDVADIRAGIRQVLDCSSNRSNLICNGLQNVQRFSKELIATEYLNLYKQL